jgi:uncharacterized surface protein with fasciclin (FAS1) repeats
MKQHIASLLAAGVAGTMLLAACGGSPAPVPVSTTTVPVTTEAPQDTGDTGNTGDDAQAAGDIVEVATGAGMFMTLLAAAEAAGLVDVLKGQDTLTVFAPTDEAFALLPEGLVDKLLLAENIDVLRSIITYHVLSGVVTADMIISGDLTSMVPVINSLEGSPLEFLVTDQGGVVVNDANVISADVPASNGVIHVIDAVLLPPGLDLSNL